MSGKHCKTCTCGTKRACAKCTKWYVYLAQDGNMRCHGCYETELRCTCR